MVSLITCTLTDDVYLHRMSVNRKKWAAEIESYARQHAGLTVTQVKKLNEEATAEFEDPRISLYYAALTMLHNKVLARAMERMFHPAP
jgi:dihydroorotase-like cyclic amidohydrolase